MLKKLLSAVLCCFCFATNASAQNNDEFFQDLLISDEVRQQDAEQKAQQILNEQMQDAQESARNLLKTKVNKIKIDVPEVKKRPSSQASLSDEEVHNLDEAPFGLLWQADEAAIKNLGVVLTPIDEKDYPASFIATQLPKEAKGFREVRLSFGDENQLWRIIAITDLINDTPDAEKSLRLYNTYAKLLDQKYGNQQDFYTPVMKEVQKTVDINGKEIMQTVEEPEEIGNPNFLAQLQSGEATLYATFEGNGIGAALALNVDGAGRAYISIDYKNLKVLQQRENETLDIL